MSPRLRALRSRRRILDLERRDPAGLAAWRGLPVVEGASPFESLMNGDRSYMSPSEEFGGRPKPNFLAEELEAGARQQAAARAEAEAKKKARG
jgi:hypothetical protein